jgi:octaprenyl-diphosphate synthase
MTATRPATARTPFDLVADELTEADRILDEALLGLGQPALLDQLAHYRGKRLRPALLLLAAKSIGTVTPSHLTLAAVVEMIHTATLVHDDILDGADERRHVRTIHREWGSPTAVLLGDALFTNAFYLASTVDARACRLIGEATNRVCAGELRQVGEQGNLHLRESDYFAILDGKTAALVEVSTRLGAAYAGASEEIEERLARYGRHLGLAFQIADDVLDYVGDERQVGKTLGTDAAQLKLTLPVIHALAKLPLAEADDIRDRLAGDLDAMPTIRRLLVRTGSIAYAKYRADEHAAAAVAELDGLPDSPAMALLRQLPAWAIRRSQ